MIVLNRFRVPVEGAASFRAELEAASEVLAGRPGCLEVEVGRNVDDVTLWVLRSAWRDVGSYRRALSSYEVKVQVVPLLSTALDEPSAYEVVTPGAGLNESSPRSLP